MVTDCDTFSHKQLIVPHGNQIFNLEILSNVFTLLNCPDKNCLGKPRLHKHITRDGLQRFFLLKCYGWVQRFADFPASIRICSPPDRCINTGYNLTG